MFSSTTGSGRRTTTFRTRSGADVSQTFGTEDELDITDDNCQIIASPRQTSSNESADILPATSGPDQMTNESDVRSSNKSSPGHVSEHSSPLQATSSPTCDEVESADLQAIADSRIVEFFVKNKIPVQVRMFTGKKFFTFLSVFLILIFYIFFGGLQFLGQSFSFVAHHLPVFSRDVLIRTQGLPQHVFWPSGSISTTYGSGSFYHEAKNVRKTFIPTFCDYL
jgi:hypothetical protein